MGNRAVQTFATNHDLFAKRPPGAYDADAMDGYVDNGGKEKHDLSPVACHCEARQDPAAVMGKRLTKHFGWVRESFYAKNELWASTSVDEKHKTASSARRARLIPVMYMFATDVLPKEP